MKYLSIFAISILISLPVFSQKKNNEQLKKIKTTTVFEEDFEKNNGRQIKESFTKFDLSGNIIEEIEYDEYGKVTLHMQYEYDKDGNKTKEIYYNSKGTIDKTWVYSYENGLKKEKHVYKSNGKLKSKKKYLYEFH